jgi:hypothetical protein
MILGRTPAGLIKIKKDSPLGLRAVNCACCNPCGCSSTLIPASLRETLENATSAFIWGYDTNEFGIGAPEDDFFWFMNAFFPAPEGAPYNIFVEMVYFKNGCLYFRGEYITRLLVDPDSFAAYGDPELCVFDPGETYETGNFSINEGGEFPYWYATSNGLIAPPVPNIAFS